MFVTLYLHEPLGEAWGITFYPKGIVYVSTSPWKSLHSWMDLAEEFLTELFDMGEYEGMKLNEKVTAVKK